MPVLCPHCARSRLFWTRFPRWPWWLWSHTQDCSDSCSASDKAVFHTENAGLLSTSAVFALPHQVRRIFFSGEWDTSRIRAIQPALFSTMLTVRNPTSLTLPAWSTLCVCAHFNGMCLRCRVCRFPGRYVCFSGGGWFAGWSRETYFTNGRCARAVPALCPRCADTTPMMNWQFCALQRNFSFAAFGPMKGTGANSGLGRYRFFVPVETVLTDRSARHRPTPTPVSGWHVVHSLLTASSGVADFLENFRHCHPQLSYQRCSSCSLTLFLQIPSRSAVSMIPDTFCSLGVRNAFSFAIMPCLIMRVFCTKVFRNL